MLTVHPVGSIKPLVSWCSCTTCLNGAAEGELPAEQLVVYFEMDKKRGSAKPESSSRTEHFMLSVVLLYRYQNNGNGTNKGDKRT